MSGDNDPVIPLANATGGCAVAAILPQGAGRKASRNRGAWPIHGDRTLLEPMLRDLRAGARKAGGRADQVALWRRRLADRSAAAGVRSRRDDRQALCRGHHIRGDFLDRCPKSYADRSGASGVLA